MGMGLTSAARLFPHPSRIPVYFLGVNGAVGGERNPSEDKVILLEWCQGQKVGSLRQRGNLCYTFVSSDMMSLRGLCGVPSCVRCALV